MITRQNFISLVILLSFALWISAREISGQDSSSGNENFSNNGSHWINCTINNEVHYDTDCLNWLEKFITWIGIGMFILIFLICGCLWYCICSICQIICCTEQPREVIYTRYVYPPAYTQIP